MFIWYPLLPGALHSQTQVLRFSKVQDLRFMPRTSKQGLTRRGTTDPAILKRDPRYGPRPPSLRQWLLRGGVHTSACCVFCCLLCFILFCFSCLDLPYHVPTGPTAAVFCLLWWMEEEACKWVTRCPFHLGFEVVSLQLKEIDTSTKDYRQITKHGQFELLILTLKVIDCLIVTSDLDQEQMVAPCANRPYCCSFLPTLVNGRGWQVGDPMRVSPWVNLISFLVVIGKWFYFD